MPKGPTVRFDVPPSKWFIERNLHHVEEFTLQFSLKNGHGELTISDLVLDKEGNFKTEAFGGNAQFKLDIQEYLSDAFCVFAREAGCTLTKDAWFKPRPCRITIDSMPDKPLEKKP
jgi:hypothetical protein